MRIGLALILIAHFSPAPNRPRDDATKIELDQFQGTWILIAATEQGRPEGKGVPKHLEMTVIGDKVNLKAESRDLVGRISVDPSKKLKEIDLMVSSPDGKNATVRGIYLFEGNNLKLCVKSDPSERPNVFANQPGAAVLTLQRKEP